MKIKDDLNDTEHYDRCKPLLAWPTFHCTRDGVPKWAVLSPKDWSWCPLNWPLRSPDYFVY